jgi:TetR/AcrR family transcriptional regulator
MTPARKIASTSSTRDLVFDAAATLFSSGGFDGVSMDDIARAADVNKAMIYYHFADKLTLYRAIVADGLETMSQKVSAIASSAATPPEKLDRFIEAFVRMTQTRPWMPAMMLREIAEGAPRLDPATLEHMRGVIGSFVAILKQGQQRGVFRTLHPILAYESVVGPIIINAARERVAAQTERKYQDFPMLVEISHEDVIRHSQETARRMLAIAGTDITPGTPRAQKAQTI